MGEASISIKLAMSEHGNYSTYYTDIMLYSAHAKFLITKLSKRTLQRCTYIVL